MQVFLILVLMFYKYLFQKCIIFSVRLYSSGVKLIIINYKLFIVMIILVIVILIIIIKCNFTFFNFKN